MSGSNVTRIPDRGPGKRRNERVHERRKFGGETRAAPEAPTHAGPRQLAVDVAAHGLADRLDILRDCMLAVFAQASRVRSERRKRRLEPMGEVGGPAARALDLPLLGIEQRVDLLDQRPNLDGHRRAEMTAASCPDVGNAAAQQIERPQTEADLDRGGDGQHKRKKRRARCARSFAKAAVAADTRARSTATATRTGTRRSPIVKADRSFRDKHARAARSLHLVTMHLARRGLIDRQRHRRVPQRA